MSDDFENNDDLTVEQLDALRQHADKIKRVIEWTAQMPDLNELCSVVALGVIAARQELEKTGVDEAELKKVFDWLSNRYTDVMLISGVARGHLGVRWNEEKDEPAFCLTEQGRTAADRLMAENPELGR